MTKIFNDPAQFAEEQLAGFCDLYADRLSAVPGGVVAHHAEEPQVAVVIGGGSGHYPAFCGTVGPGLAAGAVVGNIFTSPSATQAYNVARAADRGRGVIFSFGNYAGDNMNFGIAAKRLADDGIDARIVVVTDDIASADEPERRRGIAGDFTVFKIMGAAAARGLDIDEVERLGRAANDATRSLGVAFSGCTMPGADEPLFSVPEGQLGLGLGIHGEPGIRDIDMLPAGELAELLVNDLLAATPEGAGTRVTAILNGLGTTKYEELFLLWGHVARLLRERGLEIVEPEVGELVTSLDMGGCSLTLMWLDAELETLWRADAYTPAYRKEAAPLAGLRPPAAEAAGEGQAAAAEPASPAGVRAGEAFAEAIRAAADMITTQEAELGRIDAIAGDGDHGRGMVRGLRAAVAAIDAAPTDSGIASLSALAGRAWADHAGGTSGVLWGAALEAFGRSLDQSAAEITPTDVAAAARSFVDEIAELGGARPGDKTLLDASYPFVDELDTRLAAGDDLAGAWAAAAASARAAAEATADLRPQVGRARPLAEKSLGHPDAGAVSMAMILTTVADVLADRGDTQQQPDQEARDE
ncbi:dihydroxyacetone kinase family protein [Naumannella huperziae]